MNPILRRLRLFRRTNWLMNVCVMALLVVGVLFVYSSRYISSDVPIRTVYGKQLLWATVGFICYVSVALVDYHRLLRHAWVWYGVAVVLLVLVSLMGRVTYGARRWLELPGLGVGVQPSELAKLSTIFLLARIMAHPAMQLEQLKSMVSLLAVMALPMLLIMTQPDLGTAAVFLPIGFLMMFVAGVPLRYLGALVALGLVVVSVFLGALFLPEKLGMDEEQQAAIMRPLGLREYHRDRIAAFIHPGRDPLGSGWNKMQSEIAVGSGGVWGKGYLKGTQNILGFLPRSVAHTDFIYSVIAEEEGFAGSMIVLALFAVVIAVCVDTALGARDKSGRLLCIGVVSMFFCHVFVNIGMTVGILPITGLPLPLLSYGGSFMVVMMAALGVVQSVAIRSRRLEFSG